MAILRVFYDFGHTTARLLVRVQLGEPIFSLKYFLPVSPRSYILTINRFIVIFQIGRVKRYYMDNVYWLIIGAALTAAGFGCSIAPEGHWFSNAQDSVNQ